MTDTPRNRDEMLLYCREQHQNCSPPSKYGSTWEGDCQAFVHVAWGVLTGGFGSAYMQWLGLDPSDRHPTSDLSSAPLGASLFSKGSNPAGHTYIAARHFASGVPAAWSTDLWQTGKVGKVARSAPASSWGQKLLGWGTSVNGYALDLSGANPPKPLQNKRYERLQTAINNIEHSLETARTQHDTKDVQHIKAELDDMKQLYSQLRHA